MSITSHILKSLHKLGRKIKSLDGIDEVATILAQILPGLAGPAAAFSVLGLAIPFVYLGAMGMKEEYEEACEQYDDIFASNKDTATKLIAIQQCSEHWRQVIAEKAGLSMPTKTLTVPAHASLEEVATLLQRFEENRNKLFITAFDQKYGWLGAVGMGGMLLGLFPSTALAGIGIADKLGTASPAVVAAGSGLMIASGAPFLAGQAAMFGYAYNRLERGKAAEELLLKSKTDFTRKSNGISAPTRKAVREILNKGIHFNRKHSIEYGRNTMIGQGAMMAGTVLGLSGVGGPASLACFGIGAPMTIAPAISRIIYEDKEEAFRGNKETAYAESRMSMVGIIDKDCAKELDIAFQDSSNALARIKLYSIINHLINDWKYARHSPEEKYDRLKKIAKTGDLSYFKGSGLQGDILTRVQGIIRCEENGIRRLLRLDTSEANYQLHNKLLSYATDDEDLARSLKVKDKYQHAGGAALNTQLISTLKSAYKAIRYDQSEKLIRVTQCLALQAEIEPAEHCYSALKEALIPHEGNIDVIQHQQEKFERLKQKSSAFILVNQTINKTGEHEYLWDDPAHRGDRDYSIIYIVNKNTNQLDLRYGCKASAIVAADAHIPSLTGVKMVDIDAGSHVVLGDQNNNSISAISREKKTPPSPKKWTDNILPCQPKWSMMLPNFRGNASYQRV